MKKNLITALLLLAKFTGFGQNFENYDKTKFYQLTAPTCVYDKDDDKKITLADSQLIFTVIKTESNGDRIIQFWKFKGNLMSSGSKDEKQTATEKVYLGYSAKYNYNDVNKMAFGKISDEISNLKIFKIKAEDFKNNTIPYFNAGLQRGSLDWSSGVVVLPIKTRYRPDFTFSKDITLGVSGGAKMRISHRNPTFLNLLVNVGISSVTLDALSTNNKITTPSERSAYSTSLGLVFENHSFQFGIFYGTDKLTKNDAETSSWIYNKKPWLSLGIGYQLFKSNNTSKKTEEGKN